MRIRALIIGVLCGLLAVPAMAANAVYLANAAAGGNTGADCSNAKAYTYFNSSGNWSGSPTGIQIGPDTTVHLCGIITGVDGAATLTVQGSGTSGHPVIVLFETNAKISGNYVGGNAYGGGPGAITCSGYDYVTVDGGSNGIVENTTNGTGLANQQNSTGVWFNDCSSPTIKNLTIRNVYVKTNVNDENEYGVGLWVLGGNNWLITHNTINHGVNGMALGWDANGVTTTNNVISYNTVDYGCHLINGPGDSSSGLAASNITVDHNTLGPHQSVWQDPAQSCHGDGLGPSGAFNSGSTLTNYTISNNDISTDMCAQGGNCTANIFVSGSTGLNIFNNLLRFVDAGSGPGGSSLITFGNDSSTTILIANNTFINTAAQDHFGVYFYGASSTVTFKNNIFQSLNTAILDQSGSGSPFPQITASNNNDFYNLVHATGAGAFGYYTFAGWQGLGFDAAGSTGNPLLNSNYVPQAGSAAIGLGANLTSLSITALDTDIYGVARPISGAWDSGAAQSGGPAPTNLNIQMLAKENR